MKKKIAHFCNMTGLGLLILAILVGIYAWHFDSRKWMQVTLIFLLAAPLKVWGYKHSGIQEYRAKFH